MFDHLDDPNPPRPEELRDRVLVAIARRRRARRLAIAGSVGMLAAALIVFGPGRPSGARRIDVASHAPSSTSTEVSTAEFGSDAGAGPGAVPRSTTTTTRHGRAPKDTRTSLSPPTSAQQPTETLPPRTTTTSAAVEDCRASDLAVITTTDHGSYPSGATVTVTVTVQNRGNRTCIRPEAPYNADTVTITDSNGNAVWNPPRHPPGIGVNHPPTALSPGSSYTYSTTAWDQHTCDSKCSSPSAGQSGQEGNQVPPGNYIAQGHVVTSDGHTMSASSSPFAIGKP